MATLKDLESWIKDIEHFGSRNTHIQRVNCDDEAERYVRFKIYTHTNCYNFAAVEQKKDKKSYLGCIAWSRKPRAGEEHTRGRDMPDGSLSKKTWRKILADIVSYEMVRVHCEAGGSMSFNTGSS